MNNDPNTAPTLEVAPAHPEQVIETLAEGQTIRLSATPEQTISEDTRIKLEQGLGKGVRPFGDVRVGDQLFGIYRALDDGSFRLRQDQKSFRLQKSGEFVTILVDGRGERVQPTPELGFELAYDGARDTVTVTSSGNALVEVTGYKAPEAPDYDESLVESTKRVIE